MTYTKVSGVFFVVLILTSVSYADEQQQNKLRTNEEPSLELLEMLGQFEQQDDSWLKNEMNTEQGENNETETSKQEGSFKTKVSEKINE